MHKINFIHRLAAFTLAILMFATSANLAVDMHYCQGQLKSFSLFGKAKTCHEVASQATMVNCPHHGKMMVEKVGCSVEKKDCCSSKSFHFQLDQDQQIQSTDFVITSSLKQFLTAYVTVFFVKENIVSKTLQTFLHYQAPVFSRDTYVLFQSFLL